MEDRFINEFVVESLENLDRMEPHLLALERERDADGLDSLNHVFRAIHSIKGASGLAGLDGVKDLAHAMENLLMLFRQKKLLPDPGKIDVLLAAADKLRQMISSAPGGVLPAYQREMDELRAILGGEQGPLDPLGEAGLWRPEMGPDQPQMEDVPRPSGQVDILAEVDRLRRVSCHEPCREDDREYKVLVVEDDRFTSGVLGRKIAAEECFTPVMAESLAQAGSILEKGREDFFVAILDLNLPDAPDGEVVDLVMSHKLPAIILTATFSDEVRERLLAKKAVDYVLKGGQADLDYVVKLLHRLRRNQSIKVLVVDDSRSTRSFIRELLELHHYQVLEAEDGRSGLELIDAHPDTRVVITDYHMPRMDGIQLVTQLRARFDKERLAVIASSSQATGALSARFLKCGANDFLPKPFTSEEFYCRLTQNLEIQELINRIRSAGNRDFLTGLFNRRHFFRTSQILHREAVDDGRPLALAMMDIDHFKRINDTHGHAAGDAVLKEIAARLDDALGGLGLVARFGGEEFCAAFCRVPRQESLVLLNEVRKMVERTEVDYRGKKLKVTISIGLVHRPGASLDDMINRADRLLYRAKEAGRNRLVMET